MTHYKYPKTPHLPWSPGVARDDTVIADLSHMRGERVVATEKMDGENTTLYRDYIHARSLSYNAHESRTWIRSLHASIRHDIPLGMRICGENLYARHSIAYTNLPSYFVVFNIWQGKTCLSWDETVEWCALLNLQHAPIFYDRIWDEHIIRAVYSTLTPPDPMEGYVVRVAREFTLDEFPLCVAKYVRANHVQTNQHWMHQAVTQNGLRHE